MKIAFVFPGQGSQSVGMLSSFAGNETVADCLERAGKVLGEDLARLIAEGPEQTLGLTVNTQPALLTASYALYAAYRKVGGVVPDVMAGHSLGEYSALTAAGAVDFESAVSLVRFRAQAMQSAVPVGVGGMAAIIGLDDETVAAVCGKAAQGEVLEPVNFNSPGQVVIAGHKGALERACTAATEAGAKRALMLAVSAPFHSSLMKPAAEQLRDRLAGVAFAAPACEVISNIDVAPYMDAASIRDGLSRQAAGAVQWVRTIRRMRQDGVTDIVECGPGRVLTGLIRRIDPEIRTMNLNSAESLQALLATPGFAA